MSSRCSLEMTRAAAVVDRGSLRVADELDAIGTHGDWHRADDAAVRSLCSECLVVGVGMGFGCVSSMSRAARPDRVVVG
jgi:hypothetical protein